MSGATVYVSLTIGPDTPVTAHALRVVGSDGEPFVSADLGGMSLYFAGYGDDQLAQLNRLIDVLTAAKVDLIRLEEATARKAPDTLAEAALALPEPVADGAECVLDGCYLPSGHSGDHLQALPF